MGHHRAMRHLGYTRVSTASQDAQLQLDALVDSGVQKRDVFSDVTSGSRAAIERPGMKRLLDYVELWFPPNRGGFPRRLPVRSPRRSRS